MPLFTSSKRPLGRLLRGVALALPVLLAGAAARAENLPTLSLAVLSFGTVNWELDTIRHYGLDKRHGFSLDVKGFAGGAATRVAFQGGEADGMVADWIWVARQRAAGKDFVFTPYSSSVGALMVPGSSNVKQLADLKGQTIGIAGGPLDKSWLLLRAYAQQQNLDLQAITEQVFAAPPLIYKKALQGELTGAINFWHFGAKMQAAGMRPLVTTADAASALGLNPDTPLLGYVFNGTMLQEKPTLIRGFIAASREAKSLLADDDQAWQRLKPRIKAKNDAQFQALIAGFRAGIPSSAEIDEQDAAALLKTLAAIGGRELVGEATALPEGLFIKSNTL